MTLRTATRLSSALAAFMLVLGGVVALTAGGADALPRERIVIGEGQVFEGEFGPILPANGAANVSGPTAINTDICATAPYCDVIPLTITPPESFDDEDADYFVYVELSWPSVVVEDVPVNGDTSATDLDLFIVNDPFDETAGPDEDGFAYKAASPRNPEAFTMYKPAGDWNLLVDNYASTPTNYTIKVEWRTVALPTPFESLPPEFSSTGELRPTRAAPSLASPPRPSATPSPVFQAPPVASGTLDLRPSSPQVADSSFETGFDDAPGLDEQLAAPAPQVELDPVPIERRSDPPSGLALALWLLAVPLLLTGLGGWWLQRRQANAIQI